jgi:CobQ-like glutamine amidotransferase family enzyme
MAVKRKNEKKAKMQELISNSRKIKCCYCDLNGKCHVQASKEKSESLGIITHCTLTPNVAVKKVNKKRRKVSKDIKHGVRNDNKRG